MDEAFRAMDRARSGLAQYVDNLNLGLATIALGKLPPQLVPPDRLLDVLSNIPEVLPRLWALLGAHPGSLWLFYQEIKVGTAVITNGLECSSIYLFWKLNSPSTCIKSLIYRFSHLIHPSGFSTRICPVIWQVRGIKKPMFLYITKT